MNDLLFVTLLASGILYGTPLVIAGIGELLAERSGVMNLGVEGIMLMGAVVAFWTSQSFVAGPSWLALAVAIFVSALVGTLLAAVLAFAVITMRANQVVSGLAMLILCGPVGLSSYLGVVGDLSSGTGLHRLPNLNLLGMQDFPILGPLIMDQNILVYFSWVLVAAAGYYLYRTRIGLHLRAVGEDPKSSDAMGIPVFLYRYLHTMIGGALAGVAGAYFSLVIAPNWVDNITAGAGWIAIALVIMAFWRPALLIVGAYLFGIISSLGFTFQALGFNWPPEIFSAMPYTLTIIAVIIASGKWGGQKLRAPAALGVPYSREGE